MTTRPSVYARHPRNGATAKAIAERVGTTVRTAQRWTSEPRETYLSRAAERHDRIRKLRQNGMTIRAIAAAVGCSVGAVHYALNQPGSPGDSHTVTGTSPQ